MPGDQEDETSVNEIITIPEEANESLTILGVTGPALGEIMETVPGEPGPALEITETLPGEAGPSLWGTTMEVNGVTLLTVEVAEESNKPDELAEESDKSDEVAEESDKPDGKCNFSVVVL